MLVSARGERAASRQQGAVLLPNGLDLFAKNRIRYIGGKKNWFEFY